MEGGTTFHFVTDGIASALEQAREAAGGKDVMLWGGGQVAQQYLAAGLLDELELHIVPVVPGDGARLFDNLRDAEVRLERRTTQRRNKKMNHTKQSTEDLAILDQLNKDFFHSDQSSDAKRFSEFLGEDFISQFPGITRNRAEFLDYIAKPRPFKDLAMHDVNIRILSDVALIHGRATYTLLADGAQQEALYTDTYQKREGTWVCVAACAIAPGA